MCATIGYKWKTVVGMLVISHLGTDSRSTADHMDAVGQ